LSKVLEDKINQEIKKRSNTLVIGIVNDKRIMGKYLGDMKNYLVVKISHNLFAEGFWNMDICYILGETDDNKLLIQRIEDSYTGIVEKKYVQFSEWKAYEF